MENLYLCIIFNLRYLKEWDIDWCTQLEFLEYCKNLYVLNRDSLLKDVTFGQFCAVQNILIHEAPASFKLLIKHKK